MLAGDVVVIRRDAKSGFAIKLTERVKAARILERTAIAAVDFFPATISQRIAIQKVAVNESAGGAVAAIIQTVAKVWVAVIVSRIAAVILIASEPTSRAAA